MAGLLDAMNTYEGQQGLGLLAAAGPRFDGAGFFQRLQEGMGSADKWKRQQSAAELEKLQLEAEKAKIEDYKLKALQEKQALEQAAQKRSVLSSLFTPASQGAPAFNVDSALPPEFRAGLPTQPAISPRSAGIDPSKIPAALSVGVTAKDLAELDGLRNLGQNKVARTIEGQDDQGRPVTYQIDDLGNRVGQPIFKWEKPVEVGQGNQKSFVNPITGKTQFSLPVFQSPDSVASNQVSMRGQNMTDARARDRLEFDQGTGGYSTKPLPPSAIKLQIDAIDAYGTAKNIDVMLTGIQKQIKDGKVSFGPVSNFKNNALNSTGFSTETSRNFSSFKSSLEKLRNDSLRLNTGVQTDGDAQRAWNELFQNINDTELVAQRLDEIKTINKRGAELQQLKVDSIRSNYNAEPFNFSKFNGGGSGGASGSWDAKPAKTNGWSIEKVK